MNDIRYWMNLYETYLLKEEMSRSQAIAIFKKYGASDSDISPQNLKMTRMRLARQYHPDVTQGDGEPIKLINAAYDVLKTTNPTEYSKPEFPSWQTDSRSSFNNISKNDYRDMNYFKKSMWELSGKSKERWTILAFDGHYFRSTITVFGNSKIFPEMAKAMIVWNSHGGNPYNTRAVFVQQGDDPTVILIWLDGKNISPPIPFEHDSFNKNPSNDSSFMNRLPRLLNQISSGED